MKQTVKRVLNTGSDELFGLQNDSAYNVSLAINKYYFSQEMAKKWM